MTKEMVISATPHETRVAILEDGQLCEIYVEREKEFALVGSIYKGRVTRVLPGMQSAFVDIGLDSDAFLYVSDFLEDVEEYDQIAATVEDKIQKMEEQGGQVFPGGPELHLPAGSVSETASEDPKPSFAKPEPAGEAVAASTPAAERSEARPFAPYEGRNHERRGYGRGGGRHGRRGRRDYRYGRELPASKYSSHRPYEPPTQESSQPYEPIILPGESLAKYKERKPATATSEAPVEAVAPQPVLPEDPASAKTQALSGPPAETGQHSTEVTPRWLTGLEPLPGETISKARTNRTHQEAAPVSSPQPPATENPAEPEPEAASELHESGAANFSEPGEFHPPAELSPEEATALAEHVAEAIHEEAQQAARDLGIHEAEGEESADAGESPDAGFEDQEVTREAEGESPAANSSETAPPPRGPLEPEAQPTQARIRGDFRARMQHPMRRGGHRRDHRDHGRRSHYGPASHRPQPRRPQLISELLKAGQEIIVQIAKEPLGKKGARITSHTALPGRYLVYMPTLNHTGVSRKIASAEERIRLRQIVNEAKGDAGGGFIVRTAAERASAEEIRSDAEFLTRTWSEIKSRAEQRKAPALLHRDLNLVERILRDYLSAEYSAIWVDSEEEFAKVLEFVNRFQPQYSNRVKLYMKDTPIFEEFGIQQEVDKGLRPKVWLKSGGYIVINHTEALVAIDVNTGKFVGRGSTRLEDTIVRTNLEAVKEIVRQMRLRDLGGIIIIDFIDMEERRNREKVMAALDEALRADRAPSKVLRFNEFGLVAITRKRTKQALERTLCQPCPYCTGSGMVKSVPTLCYEIQTEARKMAPEIESASLTLRVHPEIAKALKTRESSLTEELENWTKKSIIIQADPTLHWEQYDIY